MVDEVCVYNIRIHFKYNISFSEIWKFVSLDALIVLPNFSLYIANYCLLHAASILTSLWNVLQLDNIMHLHLQGAAEVARRRAIGTPVDLFNVKIVYIHNIICVHVCVCASAVFVEGRGQETLQFTCTYRYSCEILLHIIHAVRITTRIFFSHSL